MARKSREKLSKKRSIKGYEKQAESNQLLKLFFLVPYLLIWNL
ncbi:MAG: hypothetical protein U9Q29_09495 [Campylobacterota bacterium]|nr:hypothetical protein [Campylobacterota bacterium]